jgi:transcriptional regulator with XRE-family HTH domain
MLLLKPRGGDFMGAWSTEVFAKNLQYYISKKGISQRELAEIIGVSAPTINEWVKGKKYPRINKVEKLATYFGCLKSDLIEDKEKQSDESELSMRKREFIKRVEKMTDEQLDRLERILALVENTNI